MISLRPLDILALCLLLSTVGCTRAPTPEQERDIQAVFDLFITAVSTGDAEQQATVLSNGSFDDCRAIRQVILHADSGELSGRDPLDRVVVCAVRRQLGYDEITTASCRDLYVATMRHDGSSDELEMDETPSFEFDDLRLTADTEARATLDVPNGELTVRFVLEDGQWRIALDSLAEAVNAYLESVERRSGRSIEWWGDEMANALSFGFGRSDTAGVCDIPVPSPESAHSE